jgi:outer membrane biosynthesis protein TonB
MKAPDAQQPGPSAKHSRALAQCSHELHAPAWLVTLGACGVHALLIAGAVLLSAPNRSMATTSARTYLEVELPPAPPPATPAPAIPAEPPPPEPEPLKLKPIKAPSPVPPPVAAAPEPAVPPPAEPAAPAPAAAQAAEALTQTEAAPADAPGDTLVTGQGTHYAGGTSESGGTSQRAVAATSARAFGVEGGTGNAPPDRSRAAELASGLKWDCPTPDEALEEGVEHATVALLVEVDKDGSVMSVEVKSDPGYGFGREARTCALRKRWVSALDRAGQPLRAKRLVNVNF